MRPSSDTAQSSGRAAAVPTAPASLLPRPARRVLQFPAPAPLPRCARSRKSDRGSRHSACAARSPPSILEILLLDRERREIDVLVRVGALVVTKHDDPARREAFRNVLEQMIRRDTLVLVVGTRTGDQNRGGKRSRGCG